MAENYHEKREARIERLKEAARKADEKSTQAWEQSNKIASHIPLGQPILVGHHSEGRHRRDISKIDNAMRKSVEESKKAEYFQEKAKAAENNTAISSDDPDALVKLQEKLAKMEKNQEFYKAVNKLVKSKKLSEAAKVDELVKQEIKINNGGFYHSKYWQEVKKEIEKL